MRNVNIIHKDKCIRLNIDDLASYTGRMSYLSPPYQLVKKIDTSGAYGYANAVTFAATFEDDEHGSMMLELLFRYGATEQVHGVTAYAYLHGQYVGGQIVSRADTVWQLLNTICPQDRPAAYLLTRVLGAVADDDFVFLAMHHVEIDKLFGDTLLPSYPMTLNRQSVRCWCNLLNMDRFDEMQFLVTDGADHVVPPSKISPKDTLFAQALVLANNANLRRAFFFNKAPVLVDKPEDEWVVAGDYAAGVCMDDYVVHHNWMYDWLHYYTWWRGQWVMINNMHMDLMAKAYTATYDGMCAKITALELMGNDYKVTAYRAGLAQRREKLKRKDKL